MRPVAFLALSLLSFASAQSVAPNVLFIAVDDLRNEHGVYGGQAITPNIDAFAKTATTFVRNYVQVPFYVQ
jgi:iduronate 2-sulfatase